MKRELVLISGSLAYDKIFNYHGRFRDAIIPEKIHLLNVSFTVGDVRESFGGTAGNIAYSLRLFSIPAAVISGAGNDFIPYRRWLKQHRIDLRGVTIDHHRRTAAAYIITDSDDNQITAFHPGALEAWSSNSIRRLRNLERFAGYAIVAPGNRQLMLQVAERCRRNHIPYLFDPGPMLPALSTTALRHILKGAHGLISNDYELAVLLRRSRLSMKKIVKSVTYVVTTLGAQGAVLRQAGKQWRIRAARPKAVVDPTGAGDAFRSGMVAGIMAGQPLHTAVKIGAVTSVYTVELDGTQTHHFTKPLFMQRFRQNYHENLTI